MSQKQQKKEEGEQKNEGDQSPAAAAANAAAGGGGDNSNNSGEGGKNNNSNVQKPPFAGDDEKEGEGEEGNKKPMSHPSDLITAEVSNNNNNKLGNSGTFRPPPKRDDLENTTTSNHRMPPHHPHPVAPPPPLHHHHPSPAPKEKKKPSTELPHTLLLFFNLIAFVLGLSAVALLLTGLGEGYVVMADNPVVTLATNATVQSASIQTMTDGQVHLLVISLIVGAITCCLNMTELFFPHVLAKHRVKQLVINRVASGMHIANFITTFSGLPSYVARRKNITDDASVKGYDLVLAFWILLFLTTLFQMLVHRLTPNLDKRRSDLKKKQAAAAAAAARGGRLPPSRFAHDEFEDEDEDEDEDGGDGWETQEASMAREPDNY